MVGEPDSPSRGELLDLYKLAVEEYRFQVKLNADRSRDYVVLNSAIIAAGITLLGQAQRPELAGIVFLVGVVVAVLSILGTHTQHGYYRDTRNAKNQLAHKLGIADVVLFKTKPSGSRYRRFGSVTAFNYIILSLLCMVDLTGALSGFGIIPRPAEKPATKPAMAEASPPAPPLTTSHSSSAPASRQSPASPRHP
jgi:hypothetical protein